MITDSRILRTLAVAVILIMVSAFVNIVFANDEDSVFFAESAYAESEETQNKIRADIGGVIPKLLNLDVRIKTCTITWENPLIDFTGAQIQYGTSADFDDASSIDVQGNGGKYTITGLEPATVYYFRVRFFIVIGGQNVYSGWSTAKHISTYDKDGNMASFTFFGLSACKYNGKAQKSDFSIVAGGRTLEENKDYTVSYKNNKSVGTATVIIRGCGDYFGTIKQTFKINPPGTKFKKAKAKSRAVYVRWKKRNGNCSGYQVRYSEYADMSDCKTKTIKGRKKISCTINKLSPNTKYYMNVRVYKVVKGKKYYSAWSAVRAVKTK